MTTRKLLVSAVAVGAWATAALAEAKDDPAATAVPTEARDAAPTEAGRPAAALELTDEQMDRVSAGGKKSTGLGFGFE